MLMKDREHHRLVIRTQQEVDGVRKLAEQGATDITIDDRRLKRHDPNAMKHCPQIVDEAVTEVRPSVIVPAHSVANVGLRKWTNHQALHARLARLANSSASRSSQDRPALGSAS